MLVAVWIAVVVLSLVVLGGIGYGLMGAAGRLRREIAAAQRELAPVLEEVRRTADRAARTRERRADAD